MPKVPYSYEGNCKLVTGNGSLLPSLTVVKFILEAEISFLALLATVMVQIWNIMTPMT